MTSVTLGRSVTFRPRSLDSLAEEFQLFVERKCDGRSVLYAKLATHVATSEELLRVCLQIRHGQPAPNIFLAQVHAMLLGDHGGHALADFYPDLASAPMDPESPALLDAFDSFCSDNRDEIESAVPTRTVQTHEVRRTAMMVAAMDFVRGRTGADDLHFIDVGCSAGLTMMWPEFAYRFEPTEELVGQQGSPVIVSTQVAGGSVPQTLAVPFTLASIIGIESQPVPVDSEEALRWVRALTWPNRTDWQPLFDAALALARSPGRPKLDIRDGDAGLLLPDLLAQLDGRPVCLAFSFSEYQMFSDHQGSADLIAGLSDHRQIFEIAIGNFGRSPARVLVREYGDGALVDTHVVAECGVYGEWIRFLD